MPNWEIDFSQVISAFTFPSAFRPLTAYTRLKFWKTPIERFHSITLHPLIWFLFFLSITKHHLDCSPCSFTWSLLVINQNNCSYNSRSLIRTEWKKAFQCKRFYLRAGNLKHLFRKNICLNDPEASGFTHNDRGILKHVCKLYFTMEDKSNVGWLSKHTFLCCQGDGR